MHICISLVVFTSCDNTLQRKSYLTGIFRMVSNPRWRRMVHWYPIRNLSIIIYWSIYHQRVRGVYTKDDEAMLRHDTLLEHQVW